MLINRTHSAHAREKVMRNLLKTGAPGEIRTPDLLLRRQSLYPAELRARTHKLVYRAAGKPSMPSYKVKPQGGTERFRACWTVLHWGQSARRHDKFSAVKKGLGSTRLIASATAASASSAAISTTASTVPVTSPASAMFRLRTGFVYVKRTTANF
jgi:hypothetical protein